jgi:DedD protein
LDRKLQQRLVGISVLAAFVLLIAPVLLDADGRIPEKITNIPPQPKRPDLSHIRTVDSTETEIAALPTLEEVEFVIDASANESASTEVSVEQASGLWSVQVASFKDPKKASIFRDKLRGSDFKVYVREKLLSDQTLFTQIFVGPVQTKADASALKLRIKQEFKEQGLVVRFRSE